MNTWTPDHRPGDDFAPSWHRRRDPGHGPRSAVAAIAVGTAVALLAIILLLDGPARLAAVVLLVCAVAVTADHLVRRLLRPVAAIHTGLDRIGRGDLARRLPENDRTGLGCLVGRINALAEQLHKERERSESREQAITNTLGQVAEGRSRESASHMLRVGLISARLARLAGLPEEEAELLRQAAPLHDIGKVGIPDSILMKPGAYTPRDHAAMKSHAELGHRILVGSRLPVLHAAAAISLAHHERWDGLGYPNGLTGKEIPIHGRIVGLADAFDAMFSHRSYRKALSTERGLGIINSQRGHHFDPSLVDLLMANLESFQEIIAEHGDRAPTGHAARTPRVDEEIPAGLDV